MSRIPRKQRCFEGVFKRVPVHKIRVLFENDSFFLLVAKFVFTIYFKIREELIVAREGDSLPVVKG